MGVTPLLCVCVILQFALSDSCVPRFLSLGKRRSVGHALRDLDSMDSIRPRQDFILVQAGAFFSLDLASVIDEHRARRQKNNNWAMTLLFSRFDPAKDR